MSDDLRARIAAVIAEDGQRPMATATRLADQILPIIDEVACDTYLMAVGTNIQFIEYTTTAAAEYESERDARIIRSWANRVVTAMRSASASIPPPEST